MSLLRLHFASSMAVPAMLDHVMIMAIVVTVIFFSRAFQYSPAIRYRHRHESFISTNDARIAVDYMQVNTLSAL